MAFGDRLKEAREFVGYSRTDLAEKLGVTKSAISNYENGVSSPKEDILLKIFDVLNIEPNYLFQDSFTKISLQQKEMEIIEAYRKQPHLHEAVQKVLGIYNDTTPEKNKKTPLSHHDVEVATEVGDLAKLDADEVLKNNHKTSSVD